MTKNIYVVFRMFPDKSINMMKAFYSPEKACLYIDSQEDPDLYDYEITWLEGDYND